MTSDEALALFQQPHILWTSTDDLNALIGRLHLAGRVLAAEVRTLRQRLAELSVKELDAQVDLDELRQRHAREVKAAFGEGYDAGQNDYPIDGLTVGEDAAWLASEAKARLT